ncbi:lipid-A-disaccharide synthase [Tolumonas osonensis]|uniref:Lipid-A-disaccharide synthase n=1 Tax=Tolumonas osonensis TaxID=675874 RepID=A0A841GA32_9GAMM|nr:lipid-A-disaccharide synthase [Tolumonas osonensis]
MASFVPDLSAARRPLRIGIIAGEVSGDILAAGLMSHLRQLHPDCEFVGIAGPRMQELGIETLFEMEELSVMGLVEVLGRLPRLLHVRRQVIRYFKENPPDIFIGVDAPDFNIGVELQLKQAGIKTIHYVSPSVWAWRQSRIHKIKRATNMVLAFLPFEKAFYDQHNAPCRFVGHTMADAIPLQSPKAPARELLQLKNAAPVVAVLPGSRGAEVEMLTPSFLQACQLLQQKYPDLQFVVPLVNPRRRAQFELIKQQVAPELSMTLVDGQARAVMTSADVILLASGTATLEAMLVKRPMVVAYKVKPFTFWLGQKLVKIRTFSLPNLLAGRTLVPELIQDECVPEKLAAAVGTYLQQDNQALLDEFTRLHQLIRCDADKQAAQAVIDVLQGHI